ncbi:MAG TPA: nucleotidyltransferase domain-containing protein [Thermoanaerobaculia bacterium]|nr:nucleotidyltransferase domain-containing protein [Thermoanaerobaculia bacterium]
MSDRRKRLDQLCQEFDLLAVYLFGSRADDGLAVLDGERVDGDGSDLDVGVIFRLARPAGWDEETEIPVLRLGPLQVELAEVFAPLQVDLVPLQRVDALFQFAAADGHRVAAPDAVAADYHELYVMRRAAELLPIERRLEEEEFGVSTA